MPPALILTAGLGTRLRSLSRVRAKAALPVGGTPLVARIIRALVAVGVDDVVLNLHHLPDTVTAITGDGSHLGGRVRYSWETTLLGSAGGPRRAIPLLGRSPFLILNGDTLTDVDVPALVAAHTASGAAVTMAVVPHRAPGKYGGVRIDADGTVVGFSRRGETSPSFHFVGVQVATAAAFAAVPEGVPYESVATLYPALLRDRPGAVRAFVTEAECLDIGTPADYLRTSLLLTSRGRAADLEWRRALAGGGALAAPGSVAPDATLVDCVVWDGASVGAGARLERCVVTDGATVPPGARWTDVVIRPATTTLSDDEVRVGGLALSPIEPDEPTASTTRPPAHRHDH